MALQYWNGSRWVRVSEAEARIRRARGQEVVEAKTDKPAPPMPVPVKSLADLPAPPEKTQPMPPVMRAPAIPMPPADMTDDELELLTAPDKAHEG